MADLQNVTAEDFETSYLNLTLRFKNAKTLWEFEDLLREFKALSDYKDSNLYARDCNLRIQRINKDLNEADYNLALNCFYNSKTVRDFKRTKTLFEALGRYKDSEYYVGECEMQISLRDVNYHMFETKPEAAAEPKVKPNRNQNDKISAPSKPAEPVKTQAPAKPVTYETESFDKKTHALISKVIRTVLILFLYVPAILYVFILLLVMIFEFESLASEVDGSLLPFYVLFIGILVYNIVKVLFCIISLLPFWDRIENKIPLIKETSRIKNIFLQTLVRLCYQFLITVIFYTVLSVILIMVAIGVA